LSVMDGVSCVESSHPNIRELYNHYKVNLRFQCKLYSSVDISK